MTEADVRAIVREEMDKRENARAVEMAEEMVRLSREVESWQDAAQYPRG